MPGGQVEVGESIQAAAIRETREETGIDVEIIRFCGVYQNINQSICNILFLAKPIGGEPTPSEESLEVGFFPFPQALEMVTWNNFRQRIEDCINSTNQPFLVEF